METIQKLKGLKKTTSLFSNNYTIGKRFVISQSYSYIPLDYVKLQLINVSNDTLMNYTQTSSLALL